MSEQITVRQSLPADKHFIYATFLRALFYGSPEFYGKITKSVFFAEYERIVAHLLAKSHVYVACLADDEEVIVGYCITEPGVLHFIYVKEPFRKMGVATRLLHGADVTTVTHITKIGDAIRRKRGWELNPFKI